MNADRRKRISALMNYITDLQKDIRNLGIRQLMDTAEGIKSGVEEVRDEEQEAFDNLSENLQTGERGQDMQEAITNLENTISQLEELITALDGASALEDSTSEALGYLESARGT